MLLTILLHTKEVLSVDCYSFPRFTSKWNRKISSNFFHRTLFSVSLSLCVGGQCGHFFSAHNSSQPLILRQLVFRRETCRAIPRNMSRTQSKILFLQTKWSWSKWAIILIIIHSLRPFFFLFLHVFFLLDWKPYQINQERLSVKGRTFIFI